MNIETYEIPELRMTVDVFQRKNGRLCGAVTIIRDDNREESLAEEGETSAYNAAMDGVESLLLALVCEGYDLREEKMKSAIRTTIDALSYQLD